MTNKHTKVSEILHKFSYDVALLYCNWRDQPGFKWDAADEFFKQREMLRESAEARIRAAIQEEQNA